MKRAIVALMAVVMMGVAAFAGPTVSLGTAFYNGNFDFAVGLGMQANKVAWDFVGVEAEFAVGGLEIDPLGLDSQAVGLGRINLTFALPGGSTGPQWYLLYGVGIPSLIHWGTNHVDSSGFEIGTVFGLSCEAPSGHGASLLGYYEGGELGVGAELYIDLFGLTAKTAEAVK